MQEHVVEVTKIKNEKVGVLRAILEERSARTTLAVSVTDKEWSEEQLRINKAVSDMVDVLDITDVHGVVYVHETLERVLQGYSEELKRKLVYESLHGVPVTEALDGIDTVAAIFCRLNKFLETNNVTKLYLLVMLLTEKVPDMAVAKLKSVRRTAGQLFISAAIDKNNKMADAVTLLSATVNNELRKRGPQ